MTVAAWNPAATYIADGTSGNALASNGGNDYAARLSLVAGGSTYEPGVGTIWQRAFTLYDDKKDSCTVQSATAQLIGAHRGVSERLSL